MSKTAVIYWSGTGNTQAMAEAIFEGAKEVNSDVSIFSVSEITADEAVGYDNLILGCSAMGSEELEESEFEPFFAELKTQISGKRVALFGSYGWGDGEWMRLWVERTSAAGGVMIDNEGLIINEMPDDAGLEQCRELGRKAADL